MSFLMLLVGLTVFSCGKDDLSKTDMLTQTGWNLVAGKFFIDGVEDPDGADIEPCDLDDVHTFAENGVYTLSPGTVLCDEDDETEVGTWAFLNDETEILLGLDGEATPGKIDELTESVLRISIEEVDEIDGMVYRYEATFNAI